METIEESKEKLAPFLRNLAESIENHELLPQQLQSIGEFFMAYQFQEQAIKDNDNSLQPHPEFDHDDLIKFLILGWYIYCCILQQSHIPSVDKDDSADSGEDGECGEE